MRQGHVSVEAVAEAVGIAPEGALQLLKTLERQGRAHLTAAGEWSIAKDEPRQAEASSSLQDRLDGIREHLGDAPEDLSTEEVAAAFGLDVDEALRLLRIHERDGTTFQPKSGYWRLT